MTIEISKWTIERTPYNHLYKHGLPFGGELGETLKQTKDRIDKNKASMCLIDGSIGEGKTTLALELADVYNYLHGLPPLDLSKDCPQLAMGSVDFIKKIRLCYEQKLPVIVYDEAGDFSKRAALSKINFILNRTFETYRAFKIFVIVCLPSFDVLDEQLFLNRIPRVLIHVSDRTQNSGNYAVYSLARTMWIKFYMKKFPVIKFRAYAMVTPNYRGHFVNLSDVRSKQLDKISTENKLELLRGSEIRSAGLISYLDMVAKTGYNIITVRKLIIDLKIKPARVIKKVKYFHESVLNQLIDYQNEYGRRRK